MYNFINNQKKQITLNSQQLEIVNFNTTDNLYINAGAGSGKTTTLIYCLAHFIEKIKNEKNYKNEKIFHNTLKKILILGFTNSTVNEIKKKANENEKIKPYFENIDFYTIHKLCLKILKNQMPKIYLMDPLLQEEYIRKHIECHNLRKVYDLNVEEIIQYIQQEKRHVFLNSFAEKYLSLQEKQEHTKRFHKRFDIDKKPYLKVIYQWYVEEIKKYGWKDFDDLLIDTLTLFFNSEYAQSFWQNQFEFILVDEFQDLNILHFLFLKILKSNDTKIRVFGDINQILYQFNGADFSLKDKFLKDFNAQEKKLTFNYRSHPSILSKANKLLSDTQYHLQSQYYKTNHFEPLNYQNNNRVLYQSFNTDFDSYNFMTDEIIKLIKEKKMRFEDICIIGRTKQLLNTFKYHFFNHLYYNKIAHLDNFTCAQIVNGVENGTSHPQSVLKLYTIHSVKGLEFKTVFFVGFEQQFILENQNEHETKCLIYVALTRAIDYLYLINAKQRIYNGKLIFTDDSSYLRRLTLCDSSILVDKTSIQSGNFIDQVMSPFFQTNFEYLKQQQTKGRKTITPIKMGAECVKTIIDNYLFDTQNLEKKNNYTKNLFYVIKSDLGNETRLRVYPYSLGCAIYSGADVRRHKNLLKKIQKETAAKQKENREQQQAAYNFRDNNIDEEIKIHCDYLFKNPNIKDRYQKQYDIFLNKRAYKAKIENDFLHHHISGSLRAMEKINFNFQDATELFWGTFTLSHHLHNGKDFLDGLNMATIHKIVKQFKNEIRDRKIKLDFPNVKTHYIDKKTKELKPYKNLYACLTPTQKKQLFNGFHFLETYEQTQNGFWHLHLLCNYDLNKLFGFDDKYILKKGKDRGAEFYDKATINKRKNENWQIKKRDRKNPNLKVPLITKTFADLVATNYKDVKLLSPTAQHQRVFKIVEKGEKKFLQQIEIKECQEQKARHSKTIDIKKTLFAYVAKTNLYLTNSKKKDNKFNIKSYQNLFNYKIEKYKEGKKEKRFIFWHCSPVPITKVVMTKEDLIIKNKYITNAATKEINFYNEKENTYLNQILCHKIKENKNRPGYGKDNFLVSNIITMIFLTYSNILTKVKNKQNIKKILKKDLKFDPLQISLTTNGIKKNYQEQFNIT